MCSVALAPWLGKHTSTLGRFGKHKSTWHFKDHRGGGAGGFQGFPPPPKKKKKKKILVHNFFPREPLLFFNILIPDDRSLLTFSAPLQGLQVCLLPSLVAQKMNCDVCNSVYKLLAWWAHPCLIPWVDRNDNEQLQKNAKKYVRTCVILLTPAGFPLENMFQPNYRQTNIHKTSWEVHWKELALEFRLLC